MFKKVLLTMATLALAMPAAAQTPESVRPTLYREDRPADVREEMHDAIEDARKEMVDDRKADVQAMRETAQQMQQEVRAMREDDSMSREEREEKIHELRDQFEAERHAAMEEFQAKREEARTLFETKREEVRTELREKLSVIKDAKKKEIAERVGGNFNEINAKLTAQATEKVNKIEEVLMRVAARADAREAAGADVSAARSTIENAKAMIEAARSAITVQTSKTYEVAVTSEENLKNDFGAVRQQLGADIGGLRAAIKNAHDAVRDAIQALPPAPESTDTSDDNTDNTDTTDTSTSTEETN